MPVSTVSKTMGGLCSNSYAEVRSLFGSGVRFLPLPRTRECGVAAKCIDSFSNNEMFCFLSHRDAQSCPCDHEAALGVSAGADFEADQGLCVAGDKSEESNRWQSLGAGELRSNFPRLPALRQSDSVHWSQRHRCSATGKSIHPLDGPVLAGGRLGFH